MGSKPKPLFIATFESLRELTAGSVGDSLPIVFFEERLKSTDYPDRIVHPDFMSLYCVMSGSGFHIINDKTFPTVAGDIFVMSPGMTHYFEKSNRLQIKTIHFQPHLFSEQTQERLRNTSGLARILTGQDGPESAHWLRLAPSVFGELEVMLRAFAEEWLNDGPDNSLMARSIFLRILVFLARCYRNHGGTKSSSPVGRVRAQIDRHFSEQLKIADLAAGCFLSLGRLTELFRNEIGCSPREYLSNVRIEAAKRLLRNTDLEVSIVAKNIGFTDPAYFARFFKQNVGVSPTQYRSDQTSIAWVITGRRGSRLPPQEAEA